MGIPVLLCWLGMTDLNAASGKAEAGLGPVAQAVAARSRREVVLLNNWEKVIAEDSVSWLQKQTLSTLTIRHIKLSSPINFDIIYQAASPTPTAHSSSCASLWRRGWRPSIKSMDSRSHIRQTWMIF
jgi:hypothetical protein